MLNAKTRKRTSVLLMVAVALVMTIGTLAYFSDYDTNLDAPLQVKADDASIIIRPDDPNVTPENPDNPGEEIEHIWEVKNPEETGKPIAPGDHADLSYVLNNDGNSAIDVRQTIVLTSTEAMDLNNPQFRLFEDAHKDTLGAWVGGVPVKVESISADGKTIVYKIAPFVLSGAKDVVEGAPTSKALAYHFVFDKYATNEFQADKCTIDYLVEVKQHTNDGLTSDWSNVVELENFTLGGQSVSVVPAA